MPPQKSKTGLLAKYGSALKTAYEEHRNDETEFSKFGDLPPGLSGIARLTDCKFDVIKEGKENAGEMFFYAAGQVISPAEHKDKDGVTHRVQGLRTSIIEMMCDTPRSKSRPTISDHVKWVLNQLRMLGVDTTQVGVENLEATVEMLAKAKPYFKFRTWQGKPSAEYPDPRVNHTWEGAVEYDEENQDAGSATDDDTLPPSPSARAATSANGSAKTSNGPVKASTVNRVANGAASVQAKPGAKKGAKDPRFDEPQYDDTPAQEFNEMEDAESLLALANAEDEEAQQKLTDMATEAGADEVLVRKAASWDDVYDLYKQATLLSKPLADDEEEVEEKAVKKGEVYLYQPPGFRKPIECEVTDVDASRKTALLTNLDDKKKTYKGVGFDKLQPIS